MKAKDVVVSSSWVSFRHYWCILNIIFELNFSHMKQLLVKNIFLLSSTSHLIIAAIRNYLRAEKIKAFELLESREDQIKFLLDNKAQIALLQVNYNVIKNNGNDCIIILSQLCWYHPLHISTPIFQDICHSPKEA